MSLYNCKKNQTYKILHCPLNDYLKAIGVIEGTECSILTKQPLGGPLIIRINERDIALDKDIALSITAEVI